MNSFLKYALPITGVLLAQPLSANTLTEPKPYGLIAISSELSDYSDNSTSQSNDSYLKNNASRIGLSGVVEAEGGSSILYLVELGVNTIKKKEDDTIFLREYYTGIQNSLGSVLIGYTNTPTKLAQGNVDTFNDLLDMKDLIPGERVKEQLVLNTARRYGLALSMAAIVGDSSEADEESGHSVSLSYKTKALYLSYSQDSMEFLGTLHRSVVNYTLSDWTFAYLHAFNESNIMTQNEEAHVASVQYRYSDLAFKIRLIDSSFTQAVSNSYKLELGDVTSGALGVDYFFNSSTILFGYVGRYRDTSKADLDLFGAGMKVSF